MVRQVGSRWASDLGYCRFLQSDSEPDEKNGFVHLEEDLVNFRSECEDALLATCQVLGPQPYIEQVNALSSVPGLTIQNA